MSPPAAPPASASELKPPDTEWVERFRRDFDTLCVRAVGGALPDGTSVALAVSGGPDSMAMLLLAAAAFPGQVLAATVDHGLRPEAAGEAAMVAAVCAGLGVPHETLSPAAPIAGSSMQKQAREARYDALLSWAERCGAYPLLTAHHADDQAETLLMRLNRASGVAGLSGIRPWRFEQNCLLLRPLLGWRRGRLRMIAEAAGVPWVDDPSNEDPRHDRTQVRMFLTHQTLLDPAALAESAAHIAETEEALEALTRMFEADRWYGRKCLLRAADLPRELQRRLVRRAVAETRAVHGILLPPFSDAANVEPLLDALEAGRPATQAGVMVTPERDGRWHFAPAPPRRSH
ncbi:tRNA lysidine(34) synthetase TilS [Sphingomonas sp. BT-65]|uniref:tRNA lysidine(34) synthetase TilS n=1 Tax=Sphingomonas sp. BT-65 TaxID=2989821 RepID=UPI0022361128|nr:tRNA lysidine(34) synthetase TilS [Sphingomonas sp. BT-65]MCW4462114.1 tRNA lysidine(34) synthetase TilS [Sphingomonas sp. BT-65]